VLLAAAPPVAKPTDRRNSFGGVRNATHELIGVSLAVAAAKASESGPVETVAVGVGAWFGSWLPDVDQLGSRIHRRSRLERSSALCRVVGVTMRLPMLALGAVVSHRATTHSALPCLAAFGLCALLLVPLGSPVVVALAGGLGIGYAAHVFADACTPAGVQLWWPLTRRRVWLVPPAWRIRTGSVREFLLAGLVAVATGVLVVA
jgi:membrane-bound metal-dependent hydrolase YbcI (DUF457 family)